MGGEIAGCHAECAVVIATHNRSAPLRSCLENLCSLPEAPRVVVVDNASSDDTESAWKRFGNRVRFLRLRRNIGAAARTIGAREARTPFVAFCDDDCYWLPGSLQRAVERLRRYPNVAVANGRVVIDERGTTDPACKAMRRPLSEALPGVPIVYFMAGACVVRTSAFLGAGGYHPKYFIGAEESLLALDLAARGWQLWYCDDVIVRHTPSPLNRDENLRRRLVLRNRLWTAFLRHSIGGASRSALRYAKRAAADPIFRAALRDAMAGLPWILRERRRIPKELERRARAIDRALTA